MVGLLPKLQASMSQLRLSELSDHRIFKVRLDADFMQEKVASPRVQPARMVLLVAKLGDEAVHDSVIRAAEEVYGEGGNDEWSVERWYQAYKEVEERAAPKAKVGGGVSRGTWAWYKCLGDGSTPKEKEAEVRAAYAAACGEDEEGARKLKDAELERLRREARSTMEAAATASWAGLSNNISQCKNQGRRDRLVAEMAGQTTKAAEVRAVRNNAGEIVTDAKEVADVYADHFAKMGTKRPVSEVSAAAQAAYATVAKLKTLDEKGWWEWLAERGKDGMVGQKELNNPLATAEVQAVLSRLDWWKATSGDGMHNAMLSVMSGSKKFVNRTTKVWNSVRQRRVTTPPEFLEVPNKHRLQAGRAKGKDQQPGSFCSQSGNGGVRESWLQPDSKLH
jgi:hypothetical protein